MNEKGPWVSEESILEALKETVSKIKRRNLGGALDTLIYLKFERLMHPIKDQSTLLFANPGRDFEPQRVHETGEQIRLCETALGDTDAVNALRTAEAALARWKQE